MATLTKKHLGHCVLYFVVIVSVQYLIGSTRDCKWTLFQIDESTSFAVWVGIIIFSTFNFVVLAFKVVQVAYTSAGWLLYECFPGPVQLTTPITTLPLVSFRVVTRGDYPELIRKNIKLNKEACAVVGLEKYLIEIVTEKYMDGIDGVKRVKQIVVPSTYQTKRGTLFKARNLQYCLEDGISSLDDQDWIVHLDEDSVLTPDAVRGIANFINKGNCHLGQGVILYDSENQSGFMTKILMCHRMTGDFGLLRMSALNNGSSKVVLKGSFVACRNDVEKDVTFDGGPYSSVVEFLYFGMMADKKGYQFGWIEGHFEEQGGLTIREVIKQLVRACNGMRLVAKCPDLEKRHLRFINFMINVPLTFLLPYIPLILINLCFRLPYFPNVSDVALGLILAFDIYEGIFGLLKMKNTSTLKLIVMCLPFAFLGSLFYQIVFVFSVVKGILKTGIHFEVTKKNV